MGVGLPLSDRRELSRINRLRCRRTEARTTTTERNLRDRNPSEPASPHPWSGCRNVKSVEIARDDVPVGQTSARLSRFVAVDAVLDLDDARKARPKVPARGGQGPVNSLLTVGPYCSTERRGVLLFGNELFRSGSCNQQPRPEAVVCGRPRGHAPNKIGLALVPRSRPIWVRCPRNPNSEGNVVRSPSLAHQGETLTRGY